MDVLRPTAVPPTDDQLAGWRRASPLLDYEHPSLQNLIAQRGWTQLPEHERIGAACRFHGFTINKALQRRFVGHQGPFCGYGAATPNLQCPPVDWVGKDTFIQKDGINHDYGLYDTPDDFYAQHGVNLSGLKRWLYVHIIRHGMNRNVAHIRAAQ